MRVRLDLPIFAAPDDNIVWPSVEAHGLLIYVSDD
jgi:hypothetical protein